MITPTLGRVLIVDDEIELVTALCDMLTMQGYEAVGHTSAHKALQALQEQDFDLLLSDLMMPEMDGISLLQMALDLDPYLVGIVMTGQGTIQTAVDAMKVGAFDYVLKPFKFETLLPLLRRAQEMRRLRMENSQWRETVAIYELGHVMAHTFDHRTILRKTVEGAMQQVDADEGSVMLLKPDGETLCIAAVEGKDRGALLGSSVSIEQSIAGWVARNRQPLTLHGAVSDSRFDLAKPRDDISAVSLPMLIGGTQIGVLNVNATHRRPFTLGQVKALSIFANLAAVTLGNARLYTEMQQAQEKYHSIFAHAITGIFQTTPEGQFITVNPAAVRMLGYASAEALMESINDIKTQLYVDASRRSEFMSHLTEYGTVSGFEEQLYRRDGSIIWASLNARAVYDDHGTVLYYEGTIEDITTRKHAEKQLRESEARFRSVAESATDAIILCDSEEKIISWNYAAQTMFGYTSQEVLGTSLALVIPERYRGAFTDWLRGASVTHMVSDREHPTGILVESYGLRKDGSEFPLEISLSSWQTEEGIFYSGIIRDTTERKRAAEELQDQREMLYQSEKLTTMGQLLAGVSELNNPLSVVLGQATLLYELAPSPATTTARAQQIIQATERCARIVKNFLDLARQRPPEHQVVQLNQVIQEAVELLAYQLRVDDIKVCLRLTDDLPTLWADRHQLHQVVVNLISNAQQAMHDTPLPRRLTITTRSHPALAHISLEVADTGPGVPPQLQERIFEPFFTTKPTGVGIGLGLSLCHSIVIAHGGAMRVENRPGEGAVFVVDLPMTTAPGAIPAVSSLETRSPLAGKKILVVDDESTLAEVLQEMLSIDGHQVEIAANGAIALGKLREQTYDLIVSDLRMPSLDGPGLYQKLEQHYPELCRRVIFITGDTLSLRLAAFLNRTGVPTVSKPFAWEEVRRVVQRVLQTGGEGRE